MVFIIQKSQNKESKAVQLKLNELIAASTKASNRMVDIEGLTENELDVLRKFYEKLSQETKEDVDLHVSHSIDAAEDLQEQKDNQSPRRSDPQNRETFTGKAARKKSFAGKSKKS